MKNSILCDFVLVCPFLIAVAHTQGIRPPTAAWIEYYGTVATLAWVAPSTIPHGYAVTCISYNRTRSVEVPATITKVHVMFSDPCAVFVCILESLENGMRSGGFIHAEGQIPPAAPGAPANLVVTNDPIAPAQTVTWTEPNPKPGNCSLTYTLMTRPANSPWKSIRVNGTSYRNTGLTWNTRYLYRVQAVASSRTATVAGPMTGTKSLTLGVGIYAIVSQVQLTSGPTHVHATWVAPSRSSGISPSAYLVTVSSPKSTSTVNVPIDRTWHHASGLAECTVYSVTVTVVSPLFVTLPVTSAISTEPMAIPGSIAFTTITPDCGSITAAWQAADTSFLVTGYHLTLTEIKTSQKIDKIVVETSAQVAGLTCDGEYMLTVKAINSCGYSALSPVKSVVARSQTPPVSPTQLTLTATANSVSATWQIDQISRSELVSEFALQSLNGTANLTVSRKSDTLVQLVKRLPPCTQFQAQVQAKNRFGASSLVNQTIVTLSPTLPAPSQVVMIDLAVKQQNVTWTAPRNYPAYCPLQYEVTMSYEGSVSPVQLFSNSTYAYFTSLRPGTNYSIQVRAISDITRELGQWSKKTYHITQPEVVHWLLSPWSYVLIGAGCLLFIGAILSFFLMAKRVCRPQESKPVEKTGLTDFWDVEE